MLLNPERDILNHITAITGIQPDQVQDAPDLFSQVAGLWYERLKDCSLCGPTGFDQTFFAGRLLHQGLDSSTTCLDTVQLAKIFLPQVPGFKSDLSQFFGLNFQDAQMPWGMPTMAHLLDSLSSSGS